VLKGLAIPHKIEGLAAGMIPPVLDQSIIDEMIDISDEEAINCMRKIASEEGILVGVSSGANIFGAIKIAKRMGKEKIIVTIAPDSGKNYMKYLVD
jgi:cysteine synthase A